MRTIFDATQADESEAHQILARCAAETAVNLRWLLVFGDPDSEKRFRVDESHEDPIVRGTGERVVDIHCTKCRKR